MPSATQEVGQYKQGANANVTVFTGPGELLGVFISAASNTPLLKVMDGNANGTLAIDNWTPVAATFYSTKVKLPSGCTLVMGGNVTLTAIFNT